MDDGERIRYSKKNKICFTCHKPCVHVQKNLFARGKMFEKMLKLFPEDIWYHILGMLVSTTGHDVLHFIESMQPPNHHVEIDRLSHTSGLYYWHTEILVCSDCCTKAIGAMIEYPYFKKQNWFLWPQTIQDRKTLHYIEKIGIPSKVVVYYNVVDIPRLRLNHSFRKNLN